jgi:hypothetical protein
MLKLMKDAGCVNIVFGLESADNSVLKSMRKGITAEQITHALNLTYDADLMIEAGFIFGDINENTETVAKTLNFWRKHNGMHYLNLTMISVFPGSFLYKHACSTGIIQDREEFLRNGCPLVNVSKLTDSEYRDLRSQIAELRLHPHVPAKSFQIESIEPNGECDIEFACRKCGTQNKIEVGFWFGRETRCTSCNLTNFIDPFQNAAHRQDAFLAHLPAEPIIALWGAGGIYYKLMQKYSMLASERFVLIDVNPSQQGLTVCGKKIHSPDIITHQNIKCVVLTALSRKEEIRAALLVNYPSVEHILIPSFDVIREEIVPALKPFDSGPRT